MEPRRDDIKSLRVCVTGATGRLGQAFVALAEQDPLVRVRILHRGARPDGLANIEWVSGDLCDPEACRKLVEGQDVVVHLGWRGFPLDKFSAEASFRQGLLPTVTLLEALKARGPMGVVFVSSGGTVYDDPVDGKPLHERSPCRPRSYYAVAKLAAEESIRIVCERLGAWAWILRVSTAYGWPGDLDRNQGLVGLAAMRALHGDPVRIVGDPTNIRDYVHRDDIARALLRAVYGGLGPGTTEVVNIGTGVGTTVLQVVEIIEAQLGVELSVSYEVDGAAKWLPHGGVLDVTRAREQLGWEPAITLPTGVRMLLDSLRQRDAPRDTSRLNRH